MDRIDKFEQKVGAEGDFIKAPINYIYDALGNPNTQELIECTRALVVRNYTLLTAKAKQVSDRRNSIENAQAIVATSTKTTPKIQEITSIKPGVTRNNQADIIEFINYSKLDDETKKALASLSHQDIIRLKLHYHKQKLLVQKQIQSSVFLNPSNNISELQEKLCEIEFIMEFLKELEEVELLEEQSVKKEYSNIIFAPTSKLSTYFYEDIEDYSEERLKAIKAAVDKMLDGYIFKTKATRNIKGYDNLYEYKHPNGIRVLYVTIGNIIVICSLFYKDKQRSTKITGEYTEAISRFNNCSTYILENFNNPDFHIEQAELIGKLYTLLDNGISLQKKVGE